MALPTYGFWSDPETITDPELLLNIARRDPRAAIGVLANRHLTGAAFTEAVSKAEFLVKNIDYGGPMPIMRNRCMAEQMQILGAAVERSIPCAAIIARAASPQTRLQVWNTWRNDRRAAVREFVQDAASDMGIQNLRYWHTPGFLAALDQLAAAGLLPEGTTSANQAHMLRVGYRLLAATTRDELLDLGPELHGLNHELWHLMHQRIAQYPDLAVVWATTGHRAGARHILDHPTLTQDEVHQIVDAHRGDAAVQAAAAQHPSTDPDQARTSLIEAITLTIDEYLAGTGTGNLTQHQNELRNMPRNRVRAGALNLEALVSDPDIVNLQTYLREGFTRHYNQAAATLLVAKWVERDTTPVDDITTEAWEVRMEFAHHFITGYAPPTAYTSTIVEKLMRGRIPCGRLGGVNPEHHRVNDIVTWWSRQPIDQRPALDLDGWREALSAGEDGNGTQWHDFVRQSAYTAVCADRDQVLRLTSVESILALWNIHRRVHSPEGTTEERRQLDALNLEERIDLALAETQNVRIETVEVRHHELFANALGGI